MKEQLRTEAEMQSVIDSAGEQEQDGSLGVQSRVARLLIKKLSEQCEKYCILTGYERLPDRFDSDIDFMVSRRDFERIPAIVDEIAEAAGTSLFQVIPHEISARAFRLAATNEDGVQFIQPDSCSDYRHFGTLWLRADEMLAGRRWHSQGFWVPGAAHEFIYYLIKRVNKRDFGDAHGARLSRLYNEDPAKCKDLLHRFWSAKSADALTEMAEKGAWRPLVQNIAAYRRELRKNSTERFPANVVSFGRRAGHAMERILQPTGAWIALIGPDGCGKSSVIEGVVAEFAPAFQKIVRFHLRPKSLPARTASETPVTDPHGQPVRGGLYSMAKMLYLFADYWLGYLSSVRAATVRTRLVVFDRYFYDVVVDPRRVLYGGPAWLPNMLARLIPKPELVLLLDASPDVLWSRKQEVRYEEIVRQRREYLSVVREMPEAVVIDAAQPRAEVVRKVREVILEYVSKRTRRRLKLMNRTWVAGKSKSNQVE